MGITEIHEGTGDDLEQHEDADEGAQDGIDASTTESDGETLDDGQGEGEEGQELGVTITLEGEDATADDETAAAPAWVKDLRRNNREMARKLREFEAEKATAGAAQQVQEIGAKPKLDDPDIDYDTEKYEARLDAWMQKKTEKERRENEQRADLERQRQEWTAKVEGHKKAAATLGVADYEDAEEVVRSAFSDVQQCILLEADNSAALAYVIGKRPAKAKELASITNPVKFAMALAKLETQVKTTNKKVAPPPETRVKASAPVSGAVDSKLAKLMEEADRTGDRTKVAAYHREKARQAA